jgi:hypothetical protein
MCSSTALIPYVAEFADTDRFIQYCAHRFYCLAEGKKYLGKRFTLRKEVEKNPEKISLLVYQTISMLDQPVHRGFLWSAKCPITGHEVSLFGISHKSTLGISRLDACGWGFWDLFSPLVREKYNSAQSLYVEVDVTTMTPAESQAAEAILKPFSEAWENLKFLDERIQRLRKMWDPSLPLDFALTVAAHKRGKNVIPLETIEMQIAIYKQICRDLTLPLNGEEALDTIDSVQSGNLEQLQALVDEKGGKVPFMGVRNTYFALKIKRALRTGEEAMFAIGAAHFVGEHNVLEILSRQGVKISRIDLP